MKILILSATVLLSSCTRQAATLSEKTGSKTAVQPKENFIDKEIYINSIAYFPETQEFYVPLRVKNASDFNWDVIAKSTDSVTYRVDENTRSRLPMSIAEKYFDMELLDTLGVFSHLHKLITGIKLTHVEYYEPSIESYFIAVYKSTEKFNSLPESFYCMSPTNESKRHISYLYTTDTLLTEEIKRTLNIQPVYQWETKHLQITEPESLYSVLSFQEKSGNVSYLTETKGNKISLLFKQTDEYSFQDILPIPIYRNDKPILLITMAVPDTDRSLEYIPFIFNGSKYIPFYNNRINLVK